MGLPWWLAVPIEAGKKIWTFRQRPHLQVYFDSKKTYHTTKNEEGVPGFFCHVMVKNTGKVTAQNCRGRLMRVHTVDVSNGSTAPHPDFKNPVTLKWGHEPDFDTRDIEPDYPRRLDLCFALQSSPRILRFFTEKLPSGNRTDFDPGFFEVTVRCDGKGIKPIDAKFRIEHPGEWDKLEVAPRE